MFSFSITYISISIISIQLKLLKINLLRKGKKVLYQDIAAEL